MEEKFELKKDEGEWVKRALLHALQEKDKGLFAHLQGSFGVFPDFNSQSLKALPCQGNRHFGIPSELHPLKR